jgi:hypothetical protein
VSESPPSDPNRRLLEWAARARGNPNFDEGEREYRLAIARRAQEILDPGRKDTLVERVEALRAVMASQGVPQILLPSHIQHLLEWAAEDEHSLVRALEVFNKAGVSP